MAQNSNGNYVFGGRNGVLNNAVSVIRQTKWEMFYILRFAWVVIRITTRTLGSLNHEHLYGKLQSDYSVLLTSLLPDNNPHNNSVEIVSVKKIDSIPTLKPSFCTKSLRRLL